MQLVVIVIIQGCMQYDGSIPYANQCGSIKIRFQELIPLTRFIRTWIFNIFSQCGSIPEIWSLLICIDWHRHDRGLIQQVLLYKHVVNPQDSRQDSCCQSTEQPWSADPMMKPHRYVHHQPRLINQSMVVLKRFLLNVKVALYSIFLLICISRILAVQYLGRQCQFWCQLAQRLRRKLDAS